MEKTFADAILFASLGGVGIVLWFVWNLVIFHSPTAFLSGSYSSQSQTQSFIAGGIAGDYHNLWQSLRTYALATAESIGPVLFVLGVLAVILFLRRRRLSSESLAAATILVPFAFYIVAFFLGQDVMYIPYANHPPYYTFYNARFGAEMAAPTAVFIATLVQSARRWLPLAEILLALAIVVQCALTSWGGIISLQDGQVGLSCYPARMITVFLAEHYDGGRILIDEYNSHVDLAPANVPFRNEIYEGDRTAWTDALQDPSKYVEWVIASPGDLVSQHIDTQTSTFRRQYTLMLIDNLQGTTLWRRSGLPSLPTRPLPDNVAAPYAACNRAKGVPLASRGDTPAATVRRGAVFPSHQSLASALGPESQAKAEGTS